MLKRSMVFLSVLVILIVGSAAYAAPIFDAATKGDVAKIKALLKKNPALIKSVDKDGATALHFAAAAGKKDVAKVLIDAKANVNAEKKDGVRPLHVAASLGKVDVVKLLLTNKADVNAKDKQGRTALALAKAHDQAEIVKLLLTHGAVEDNSTPAQPGVDTSSAAENSNQPDIPSESVEEIAQEMVAKATIGDFAAVISHFDSNMKSHLSEAQLKAVWQQASQKLGSFQGVTGTQIQKISDSEVVTLTCSFSKGNVRAQISFNKEKQVNGLYFLPG